MVPLKRRDMPELEWCWNLDEVMGVLAERE
jgi:hypothetical protein